MPGSTRSASAASAIASTDSERAREPTSALLWDMDESL